jgi:glutamyl-tRNA(Gln) amidotransferase subunit E
LILKLNIDPGYAGKFLGQILKYREGQKKLKAKFNYNLIYKLFDFLIKNNIEIELAERMLPILLEHPRMEFDSILSEINFKRIALNEILENIPFIKKKFELKKGKDKDKAFINWAMGEMRYTAIGNIPLKQLYQKIQS